MDPALGVMVEERRRHLATSRVVDADEQDLRHFLDQRSSRLCDRPEPLPCEPLREGGDVQLDARPFSQG